MSQPENVREKTSDEKMQEILNRPKKNIIVKVHPDLKVEGICKWCAWAADRIHEQMPPKEFGTVELVIKLDYEGMQNITRGIKRAIMNELFEHTIR
ncbi:unnamed protein product [Caenorhabditis angaria]|uniref:Uncharacterized protein n=1 Tax=Caenorhabditis angaria TaxID=860376 RepID=A0A9P1INJ0_9PELO|nr:unnamed protein product [Caenorhabditis angaria]